MATLESVRENMHHKHISKLKELHNRRKHFKHFFQKIFSDTDANKLIQKGNFYLQRYVKLIIVHLAYIKHIFYIHIYEKTPKIKCLNIFYTVK